MRGRSNHLLCILLLILLAFVPFEITATKVNMGTITIEVGQDYYVNASYGGRSQSGYWKRSNDVFWFVSQGQTSCTIRGDHVGTGTLEYWGSVTTYNYDVIDYEPYWTVNVIDPNKPDEPIEINSKNFPDTNFRNCLLNHNYGKDGVFTVDELNNIKSLIVVNKSIGDLSGIEYFTALERLDCDDNIIVTFDLTKNVLLKELSCGNNKLTSIDLSNNTLLEDLYCAYNMLSDLDVSKNTKLKSLRCHENEISSLNVSKNTELTELDIYENPIRGTDMDVLISSLPKHYGKHYPFRVVGDPRVYTNRTVCTKTQVAAALSKGWQPLYWNYYSSEWQNYEGSEAPIFVTDILLNKTSLSLQTGQSETLTATVKPDNATDKSVKWSSYPEGIVTVSSTGKVTAIASGETKVYCTANDGSGVKATCDVTVTNPKPDKIVLPSEATVTAGQALTLTPTVTPANAEYTLTWSSDDETVATVNQNGVVTGVKKGKTFINVETDNGKTAYCKLTVTAAEPASIELPKNATVTVGETITITPTITPEGAETTLTWKSDDETVARIDANGVLTGVAEGLALVTVSTAKGLTSNACKVTVKPDPSGISTVMIDEKAGVPIYTPSGQRLAAPRKGVNIIGGKKVIVK